MSGSRSNTEATATPQGRSDSGAGRLNAAQATRVAQRWLNPDLRVTRVRRLYGGMVHQVCEWWTDAEPTSLVAKLNSTDHAEEFRREMEILQWYRAHTRLPVPTPYASFQDPDAGVAGLLMEKIPGTTLPRGRYSPRGVRHLQHELAHHVADLHTHTGNRFGQVLEPTGSPRWIDVFRPRLEREFQAVRDQLSSAARRTIDQVIHELERWLPEHATPTLVHGDLWATNILVDDAYPDRPRVLAFIDCGASYADPEYELAYLKLFQTADDTFFSQYSRRHRIRPGFDQRCRIYWLNTMLLHVRSFGDRYVGACEGLVKQIHKPRA